MYLEHFGFKEFPFSITPDTEFFFSSDGSLEALNTLLIAVKTGEGFIKITGEVGTGKSMLCRKLISSLSQDYQVAYIPNPYLDPDSLFREIASELGLEFNTTSVERYHLLRSINEKLFSLHSRGQRVVVCLDEAQAMPIETLEALRLLSNLETEKRKLLQVIIFGQPELEEKLNHPSIRQLKQRIAFEYHLSPMGRYEIDYYLQHRLMIAGYRGSRLFSNHALWLLKRRTHCVPRLVNIIAHKSLLSAYGKGHRNISFWHVLKATNDTASIARPTSLSRYTALILILCFGVLLIKRGYFL